MSDVCDHGRSTKAYCADCRAAEKQRSRDKDAADLASGRITQDELRHKNAFIPPGLARRGKVNYHGAEAVVEPPIPEWKAMMGEVKRLMAAGLVPPEHLPNSRAQRISWAYGQVAIENPKITMLDVERVVDEADRKEMERLRAIEKAARRLYEVQRGTMSMLAPSGLEFKKALGVE